MCFEKRKTWEVNERDVNIKYKVYNGVHFHVQAYTH